jgi:hypothetical protein
MRLSRLYALAALGALALAGPGTSGQEPAAQEHVAALKANLATSQALLKQYEWIEVTIVSLKGEEKARTEYRCYYGAEGKLQRVPVGETPSTDKKRGLRGKIAEKKKGELTEYMKSAVELVKSYVPPDPDRIEAVKNAGKMSITPAGARVRLDFRDYQKPGDTLGIDLDMAKDTLLGLTVATWLKDAQDTIGLKAGFGSLNDGATYPAEIILSAPSQNLEVKITNSGYKKL